LGGFQRKIQKFLTFSIPFFLPIIRSRGMNMVIGDPLPPPTRGEFSDRVEEYHAAYKEALNSLYSEYIDSLGTEAEKSGRRIRFIK
jgi:hypothetical protein